MKALYERIKECREQLGMTQDELAQYMGYKSRSTIAKIEAGENDITQTKIAKFANVLKTTPAYLMGWDIAKYDWGTDSEGRISSIPHDVLENLLDIYDNDIEKAWNRWWDICVDVFFESMNAREGLSAEPKNIQDEKDLLISFHSLNEKGRELAISYVNGLTEVYKEKEKN